QLIINKYIIILYVLHKNYNIQKINVVSHSYGGTEFIHAYMGSKYLQDHMRLNKVVFLGVPVEESLSDQLKYRYHLVNKSTDKNFHQLFLETKNLVLV